MRDEQRRVFSSRTITISHDRSHKDNRKVFYQFAEAGVKPANNVGFLFLAKSVGHCDRVNTGPHRQPSGSLFYILSIPVLSGPAPSSSQFADLLASSLHLLARPQRTRSAPTLKVSNKKHKQQRLNKIWWWL